MTKGQYRADRPKNHQDDIQTVNHKEAIHRSETQNGPIRRVCLKGFIPGSPKTEIGLKKRKNGNHQQKELLFGNGYRDSGDRYSDHGIKINHPHPFVAFSAF